MSFAFVSVCDSLDFTESGWVGMGYPLEHEELRNGCILGDKASLFSSLPPQPLAPQCRRHPMILLPTSMTECLLAQSYAGPSAGNHSCCGFISAVVLVLLCIEDTWVILCQTLTFFCPLFSDDSQSLWLHICAQHSLDTCSLLFCQLCVSVLTTFNCSEKLLWWGLS